MLSAACLKPLRESAYSRLYKSLYNFTSTPFDIDKLIEDAGQLSCVAFAWHLTRMQKTTLTATLVASGIDTRTGLLSACPSCFLLCRLQMWALRLGGSQSKLTMLYNSVQGGHIQMLMEAEIPASRAIMHLCIYICSKLKANEMLERQGSRS